MTDVEFEDGRCPECKAFRALVRAQYEYSSPNEYFFEVTDYKILECGGCGAHYFKSEYRNEKNVEYTDGPNGEDFDITYFPTISYWSPSAKRSSPEWAREIKSVDQTLGLLLDEVYTALGANLNVLAAIGMRTIFDRASELLDIDSKYRFQQKLKDLKENGNITGQEHEHLRSLVDAGNAAAHRAWQPTSGQVKAMMTILKTFLERSFLLENAGAELKKGVPTKRPKVAKK